MKKVNLYPRIKITSQKIDTDSTMVTVHPFYLDLHQIDF
jgi:hypothetical protein